jgi:hypothetical protein
MRLLVSLKCNTPPERAGMPMNGRVHYDDASPTADGIRPSDVTDKGKVRVRPMRISFLIAELTNSNARNGRRACQNRSLPVCEERAHLFLVADGMGGHSAARTGQRALPSPLLSSSLLNSFKWFVWSPNHTETRRFLSTVPVRL